MADLSLSGSPGICGGRSRLVRLEGRESPDQLLRGPGVGRNVCGFVFSIEVSWPDLRPFTPESSGGPGSLTPDHRTCLAPPSSGRGRDGWRPREIGGRHLARWGLRGSFVPTQVVALKKEKEEIGLS